MRAAVAAGDQPDEVLWRACRDASRSRLDDLAQRLEPAAGWNDLVLPEAQKIILRQIAAHAKHRLTVYQHWGFAAKGARGLGISALFAGESGTGKTMAAEVLADELHLDLYRIDLASVVSKYIGDTEKNLRRLFDAAEDSGAILLFDEADALFGKRSEVRDSHDRYANIEVSYLLQRMEAYRGLAILTTNMKSALDVAFQRRLTFVVQFPVSGSAAAGVDLARYLSGRHADARHRLQQTRPAEHVRRQHSQHRAQRRVPRCRRSRAGRHETFVASRAQRSGQTRPAAVGRGNPGVGVRCRWRAIHSLPGGCRTGSKVQR